MKNDLNIYELKYNLLNDFDKWINFEDLEDGEQNEICEAVADKERENFDYYHNIADDEGIYQDASEKMGYLREDTLKEDQKNLHYNLSYSQGDYAYLEGSYDLIKLLEKNNEKALANDLKFLLKQACGGKWEYYLEGGGYCISNIIERQRFILTRKDTFTCNWNDLTNIEDIVIYLENFRIKNNKRPACIDRILKGLDRTAKSGYNIIEALFIDYERGLKRQFYDTMEEQEKQDREYWINEVLKPSLKGKYNRITKEFKRECETVYKIN